MPRISARWEEYEYLGEKDSALVVRWRDQEYHVAFWRNYVPIWVFPDGAGFYFGWIEAAPYECLCDDDREHMSLELIEETESYVVVRWSLDLVTFGGRVYRGNTKVVEEYRFDTDGFCTRRATLCHGERPDIKRNKNGYEICEFGVINPPGTSPLDSVGREGVVDLVVDPEGERSFELKWEITGEDTVKALGWQKEVAEWNGQIHIIQRTCGICPFVAFGKDSMPKEYYPTKYLVWGDTFEDEVLTFYHWPKKVDEYYLYEANQNLVRQLLEPTHTPILSCQFRKECELIERPLTFEWLIGVGIDEKSIGNKVREWLKDRPMHQ